MLGNFQMGLPSATRFAGRLWVDWTQQKRGPNARTRILDVNLQLFWDVTRFYFCWIVYCLPTMGASVSKRRSRLAPLRETKIWR